MSLNNANVNVASPVNGENAPIYTAPALYVDRNEQQHPVFYYYYVYSDKAPQNPEEEAKKYKKACC